jgi:hypothetical protein
MARRPACAAPAACGRRAGRRPRVAIGAVRAAAGGGLWREKYTKWGRQHGIELALKHDLESRHRIHQFKEKKAKKRLESLPKFGPKTKRETGNEATLFSDALGKARSHGRDLPNLGDFREAPARETACTKSAPSLESVHLEHLVHTYNQSVETNTLADFANTLCRPNACTLSAD